MKVISIHLVRVTLLLMLYVCCSSVVCCEAGTTVVPESSSEKKSGEVNSVNKHSFDEDLTPLRMISIRLTELL